MSGPTKGMVAGQPIQTGAQTKAFDDGYDRIFGERRPQRGRWIWDEEAKQMVQVDAGWTDAEARAPVATEGVVYSNLRATDGTDVSSRAKREQYMKQKGLVATGDFTEHWRKADKARAAGESAADARERREIIGRALHEAGPKARQRIVQEALKDGHINRRR